MAEQAAMNRERWDGREESLPLIPPEVEKEWAVVQERAGHRIQAALRYWLAGSGYREAAQLVGIKSFTDVRDAVMRYGLRNAACRMEHLGSQSRFLAFMSNRESLRRLEDPEQAKEISFRDLTIHSGVHTDKALAIEKQQHTGVNLIEALSHLFHNLPPGTQVGLAVTTPHAPERSENHAEDVTAEEPKLQGTAEDMLCLAGTVSSADSRPRTVSATKQKPIELTSQATPVLKPIDPDEST